MQDETTIRAELERLKIELNHMWWVRDKYNCLDLAASEGLVERAARCDILQWVLGI